jgi:hypothetical protein
MAYKDDLEENLNLTIIDLVDGINEVAGKLRDGSSRDELADALEQMVGVICKRWPDCVAAHTTDEDC